MIIRPKRLLAISLFYLLYLAMAGCGGSSNDASSNTGDDLNYNYTCSGTVCRAYDDTGAFYKEWVNQVRMNPIYLPSSDQPRKQ